MRKQLLAVGAATFLTLSLSGSGIAIAQEDDECAVAVEALNDATAALNAAVEADNLAELTDVDVEITEFNDLLVGDLAVVDALPELPSQADINIARAALEDIDTTGDAALQADVDAALTALDEVEVALDADVAANADDAVALRVNFDGAVAAANAACVDDVNVTVNNDNTVIIKAPPVVEVPGNNVGKGSQVREVPRGGVATGDGSSL
jgi:hypothetical protein